MRIAVGSDEATPLPDHVANDLRRRGHEVRLFGALADGDDARWPSVGRKVGEAVACGECDQGVLFCFTGTGVAIAANKAPGVRAALCADAQTADGARRWNDANVLVMSLRSTSPDVAEEILDAWFAAPAGDSDDACMIEMVNAMDRARPPSKKDGEEEKPRNAHHHRYRPRWQRRH